MNRDADEMVTLRGSEADAALPVMSDSDDLVITKNTEAGIYEAELGGAVVAGVVYTKSGGRVTLMATSVFPEFRGKGIGARLLGGVLDMLRAQGETVTATCPYAA